MHQVIPLKRLATLKMKLLCGVAICLGVLYVATANVAFDVGSRANGKVGLLNALETDDIGNLESEQKDVGQISSLRLVQVIFRHGDRTPIDRFPLDPYNSRKFWPEGWGKLTVAGKKMQQQLGRYIRKRYDGYLSKTYTSEEIFVQSSDKDRTIQSALANLAGMWPPTIDDNYNQVQEFVPVHTIPASIDNKIAFSKSCPKYDRSYARIPDISTEKLFDLQNEELYKYLSSHTGLNVKSYYNVSDLYDILFVQKCHNLTLPAWTTTVFPDKMLPLAERWLRAQTFTDEMLRLRAGPLVTDILRNMKRVREKPSATELEILETLFHTPAAKFYVFSGHDTTISTILTALGVFDGKFPPYATSLYFELHELEESHSTNYFVKVFYRPNIHKPAVELVLKRCSSNPCKFEDFVKSVEPFVLDEKQWDLECQA